jgi:carbonic anhydrase
MPKDLIAGYHRFRDGYFKINRDRLDVLAAGQSPRICLVSCCDSRVDPATVFDAHPGDLFVIRNVANLVPPFEEEGMFHGTSAALEFAVTGLEVRHIVVLGHAHCGGIRALMDKKTDIESGTFIDRWMSIAEPVRQALVSTLGAESEDLYAVCERHSVAHSLSNLMSYPWIQSRVDGGSLSLHGWHYDLAGGALSIMDEKSEVFLPAKSDAT